MTNFNHITATEANTLLPGTILWLPPKDKIATGIYVDVSLQEGGYNHPVVITSCPSPTEITHSSHVEIAIITSFHGTPIKSHLANKGIKHRTGVEAAEKAGYIRIITKSKPYAKDVLHLRGGRGMKRDCAYVNVKQSFGVEVKALARYGIGKGEGVDAYRLTAMSMERLDKRVGMYRERRKRAEKRVKDVERKEKEKEKEKEKIKVEIKKVEAKKSVGKVKKPVKSKLMKMMSRK